MGVACPLAGALSAAGGRRKWRAAFSARLAGPGHWQPLDRHVWACSATGRGPAAAGRRGDGLLDAPTALLTGRPRDVALGAAPSTLPQRHTGPPPGPGQLAPQQHTPAGLEGLAARTPRGAAQSATLFPPPGCCPLQSHGRPAAHAAHRGPAPHRDRGQSERDHGQLRPSAVRRGARLQRGPGPHRAGHAGALGCAASPTCQAPLCDAAGPAGTCTDRASGGDSSSINVQVQVWAWDPPPPLPPGPPGLPPQKNQHPCPSSTTPQAAPEMVKDPTGVPVARRVHCYVVFADHLGACNARKALAPKCSDDGHSMRDQALRVRFAKMQVRAGRCACRRRGRPCARPGQRSTQGPSPCRRLRSGRRAPGVLLADPGCCASSRRRAPPCRPPLPPPPPPPRAAAAQNLVHSCTPSFRAFVAGQWAQVAQLAKSAPCEYKKPTCRVNALFVSKLHQHITNARLNALFTKHGPMIACEVRSPGPRRRRLGGGWVGGARTRGHGQSVPVASTRRRSPAQPLPRPGGARGPRCPQPPPPQTPTARPTPPPPPRCASRGAGAIPQRRPLRRARRGDLRDHRGRRERSAGHQRLPPGGAHHRGEGRAAGGLLRAGGTGARPPSHRDVAPGWAWASLACVAACTGPASTNNPSSPP